MIHFFYNATIPLGATANSLERSAPQSPDKFIRSIFQTISPAWSDEELDEHLARFARRNRQRGPACIGFNATSIESDQSLPTLQDSLRGGYQGRSSRKRKIGVRSGMLPIPHSVPSADFSKIVKLYILAENYNIKGLQDLAKSKYAACVSTLWNTSSFVDSIREIYEGTPDISPPDALRQLAVRTASRPTHVKELMAREDFGSLFNDNVEFGRDLVLGIVEWTQKISEEKEELRLWFRDFRHHG